MRSVCGCIAATVLVAGIGLAAGMSASAANAEGASTPSSAPLRLLFFSGGDLWQRGLALHGGALWSPRGLDHEGPAFKLLTASGRYSYRAGDDGSGLGAGDVQGVMALASAMAGWRFHRGSFAVTLLGGPDLQYHRLSRPDPGNHLRGAHAGLRVEADIWYQPAERWMANASASVSTIGPGYWARIAAGRYLAAGFWLGPELMGLGGPTHHEARMGLHVTSLRFGAVEWTFGGGVSVDTGRRTGGYVRVGALTRR